MLARLRGPWALTSVLLISCTASHAYPMPTQQPNTAATYPASIGEEVQFVVLFIEPRPGDRIELLGAEPMGELDGARVEFFLSRPVDKPDGTHVIGEQLEPLAGSVVATDAGVLEGPDNAVGVVAAITAERMGQFDLTLLRLRFRLNDGPEQVGEGISTIVRICAADPKPATDDCPSIL